MNAPRISIVVPTYNQGHFIDQTLASIVGQGWPNLELIVIDGGSVDGTHDVVEKYRSHIAHFISEKDSGQANAINKGFRLATGDILGWLNSDDMFMPCALQRIAAALSDPSVPSLVYGACLLFHEGKPDAKTVHPPAYDRDLLTNRDYILQPSSMWTRALWEKAGELNEDYHYILDWDWYARATRHCDFIRIPDILSIYRYHAAHKTSSGDPRRTAEVLEFIDKYASPDWQAAYKDVSARLDPLVASLERLRRVGLYRFRTWLHRDLYGKHDFRVRIAIGQLRGGG